MFQVFQEEELQKNAEEPDGSEKNETKRETVAYILHTVYGLYKHDFPWENKLHTGI